MVESIYWAVWGNLLNVSCYQYRILLHRLVRVLPLWLEQVPRPAAGRGEPGAAAAHPAAGAAGLAGLEGEDPRHRVRGHSGHLLLQQHQLRLTARWQCACRKVYWLIFIISRLQLLPHISVFIVLNTDNMFTRLNTAPTMLLKTKTWSWWELCIK